MRPERTLRQSPTIKLGIYVRAKTPTFDHLPDLQARVRAQIVCGNPMNVVLECVKLESGNVSVYILFATF
jgi:hypothetical protein